MLGQQINITDEMIAAGASALDAEFGAYLRDSVWEFPAAIAAEMVLKAALRADAELSLSPTEPRDLSGVAVRL